MRRLSPVLLAAFVVTCTEKPGPTPPPIDQTGVVRGVAYVDRDGDGTFNGGDTPAAGVSVSVLLDATSAVVRTATTGADGSFVLPGVNIGRYRLAATRGILGDTVEVQAVTTMQNVANAVFTLAANDTVDRRIRVGYPVVTVQGASARPLGSRVIINGLALNGWSSFGDSTVHVRDATGTARAVRVPQSSVQQGDSVRLLGVTQSPSGHMVIADASLVLQQSAMGLPVPDSVSTLTAATAGNGAIRYAQVRIDGAIIQDTIRVAGDLILGVNDGSGRLEVVLDADVPFGAAGPFVPGATFRGSGVLVPVLGGSAWRLKPRGPAEAITYFDAITIAEARNAVVGNRVVIEGVTLNNWSAFGDSTVHMRDHTGYMRAVRVLSPVGAGDSIRMVGTVAMRDGQPVLTNVNPSVIRTGIGIPPADSISTSLAASAAGGQFDASLVRVAGTISAVQTLLSGDIVVDMSDGTGLLKVVLDEEQSFNIGQYQPGAILRATGVLVPAGGGTWQLKPRFPTEAVTTYQPVTIAQARTATPGELVVIEGVALNSWTAFGDSTVHMQDASGYIRAVRVLSPVFAGDRMRMVGAVATQDNQPVLTAVTPTLLQAAVGVPAPDSMSTASAANAAGGTLDAGQARVRGTITAVQTLTGGDVLLNVNDGSGMVQIVLDVSIAFTFAQYQAGAVLRASGVLVPVGNEWRLKPRNPAEATISFQPITIAQARAVGVGQLVVVEGVALNNWSAFADSTVHLQDASGTIRAVRVLSPVAAGDRVRMIGTIATRDGQPVITLATPTVVQAGVGIGAPDSISTAAAAGASGLRDAALVRVSGTISSTQTLAGGDVAINMNDGTGPLQVLLDADISFTFAQYQAGAVLHATGVLVPVGGGVWQLKPRTPPDAIVSFNPISIATARARPAGELIVIEGIALNNWGAFGDSTVHVQDASGFIRAVRVLSNVAAGDRIRMIGTTSTRDGQPVIALATPTVLQAGVGVATPDSISTNMAASANGGQLDAAQVRIAGSVSSVQVLPTGDRLVQVSDGSGALQVLLDSDIAFNVAQYQPGAILRARGVLVPAAGGTVWHLKPRAPTDAIATFEPITIAQARSRPLGQLVVIEGAALNSFAVFGDSTVHVEDATGYIRAVRVLPQAQGNQVQAGNRLRLVGTTAMRDGQRVLDLVTTTVLQEVIDLSDADSISTAIAATANGGTLDAAHVTVGGTISATQTLVNGDVLVTVSDGSGAVGVILDANLTFTIAQYQPGAQLRAVGVLVPSGSSWRLKPRNASEATISFAAITIAQARGTATGNLVVIEGVALNNWSAFGDSTVHVEDASGTIRAVRVLANVDAGSRVRLIGTMATRDGQPVVELATPALLQAGVGTSTPDSISTAAAASASGGARDARHVRIVGAITATQLQTGELWVDVNDGSGSLRVVLDASLPFNHALYQPGGRLHATGVLVPVGGGVWRLKPRNPLEAAVTFHPISIATARTTATGQLVVLEGIALNNSTTFGDSTVHLRDQSGHIRATRVLGNVAAGDSVRLIGIIATRDGQPVINLATPTLLQQGIGFGAPDSVSTAVAGSANDGALDATQVRIAAPISAVTLLPNGDRVVNVNDGSGLLQVVLDAAIAFNVAQYQPGAILRASGVLVPAEGGDSWQLKPRAPTEAIAAFEPITIAQARARPLGQLVVIEGAALNGFTVFGDSTIHVEDASGFIRAVRVIPQAQGAQVQAGNRLRLVGTTALRDGQRVIDLVTTTVLQEVVNLSAPDSVSTTTAAAANGGARDAAHVTIGGTIATTQTLANGDVLLTVNDGSGAVGVLLDASITFTLQQYQPGAMLRAVGVLVPSGSAWRLKPRNASEATVSFQAIPISQARGTATGNLVVIEGIALNNWAAFGDSTVHVEDASGTIRGVRVLADVAAGNRIRLIGTMTTRDGQPAIDLATPTLLQIGVGASTPDSISTAAAASATGGRDADHVRIVGNIVGTQTQTGELWIDVNDGSGSLRVVLDASLPFNHALYQAGARLSATGVLVPVGGGAWRLKPRAPAEATVTYHPISIADARTTAVGQLVVIEAVALNNWTAFGDSTVHLKDPSGFIRAARVLAPVAAGDSVRMIGTIATRDGQPVVNLAAPTTLQQGVGFAAPDSVSTAGAASAGSAGLDAAHVRIAAPISAVTTLPSGDRLIDVNDGSGLLQVRLDADIAFNVAQYQPGAILRASGVLAAVTGGDWQLKPRAPAEAIAIFEPISIAQARTRPIGQLVVIEGAALNGFTVFGDSTVHVEDATGFIRAVRVIPQAQGNQVQAGNRLRLVGTTAVRDGQRVIDLVTTTVLQEIVNLSAPDSMSTAVAATANGGIRDAAHVIVGGTISSTQTLANGDVLLTVNDGSGSVGVVLDANATFTLAQYQPGAILRAVGVLVPFGGSWRVKPRGASEATVSFQAIPIAQARAAANGSLVVIEGVAINNWSAFGDSTVHLEDASGAIRAVRVLADVAAGNRVRLIGTVATRDGQPVIELATPTLLQVGVGTSTPDSISTAAAASASSGARDARHVRIAGNIVSTTVQSGELWIDVNDGSGTLRVVLDASLPFNHALYQAGARLSATGVLVPVGGGAWRLKPRAPAEATVTYHPISIATARTTAVGQLVVVEGVALNNWTAFGDSTVHLRDPSGYIRAARVLANVAAGDSVRLIGTIATRDGQPVINLAAPTMLQSGVGFAAPDSGSTNSAASANGGALDAAHVRIAAPISAVTVLASGDRVVNVNDGSGLLQVVLDAGIAFNVAQYQPGAILRASGVLVPVAEGGWQLKPRSPAEAIASFEPISIAAARTRPLGQLVVIEGAALNGFTVFGDSTVHVEDASGSIRAVRVIPQAQGSQVQAGNRLRLVGTTAIRDGQRVIDLVTTTVLQEVVNLSPADSIPTATAATASDASRDAAHVTVGGTISTVQTLTGGDVLVTINDGSGPVGVLLDAAITFTLAQYQPGALLRAVGVLVPSGSSWRVKPRSSAEATVSFQAITIAQARTTAAGTLVVIEGVALNSWAAFGDSTVHMEDASGAIRAARVLANVDAGSRVRLIGTMATRDGQPVIELATPTLLQSGVGTSTPDSISTSGAASASGGARDARHVRVVGNIMATQLQTGELWVDINDGSGPLRVVLDASIGFNHALYQVGGRLHATGVLVPVGGGVWRLKPRSPLEAAVTFHPISIETARTTAVGQLVVLEGVALNNWTAFGDSTVHLRDPSGFIRATRVLSTVAAGDSIRLIGTVATRDGQPVINLAVPTTLQTGIGVAAPDSVSTSSAASAVGGTLDAGQVRIAAPISTVQVLATNDRLVTVNDGSGVLQVVLDADIAFNVTQLLPGAILRARGVLVPAAGGGSWQLRPRSGPEALAAFEPISIALARTAPLGQLVVIEGAALNGWTTFGDSTVHVEDASGTIRASRVIPQVQGAQVQAGNRLRLVGTTAVRDGQRVIDLVTTSVLQEVVNLSTPDSVSTATAATASSGTRDAAHVVVGGTITATQTLAGGDVLLTVNDGSGAVGVVLDASIAFSLSQYQAGALVRATGVLVPSGGSWRVRPRSPSEATISFQPITIAQARAAANGALVVIEGVALNNWQAFGDSTVHLADASGTIRATRVVADVGAGNRIRLIGTRTVRDGQPVIDLGSPTLLQQGVGIGTIDSVSTAAAAAAATGALDANHVRIAGAISLITTLPSGDRVVDVSDGSGVLQVVLDASITFNIAQYQPGAILRASGVLVPAGGAVWQLKPRTSTEAIATFEPISIAQARTRPLGQLVVIEGAALNGLTVFGDSTLHLEDATGYIRAVRVIPQAQGNQVQAGNRLRLVGTTAVRDGQRVIELATTTVLQEVVNLSNADSISTTLASTANGGVLDAAHVTVGGTISATQTVNGDLLLTVNDGSGAVGVLLDANVAFNLAQYQPGAQLRAVGVLVPSGSTWRVKPRSPAEATISFQAITIAQARTAPTGTLVVVEGVALNNWSAFGDSTVHIEDASGAIRAVRVLADVGAGNRVRFIGTTTTRDGQPVIDLVTPTLLQAGVGLSTPDSISTSAAASAAGGRDARHVRVVGNIITTQLQTGELWVDINDGSGPLRVVLDASLPFNHALFQAGGRLSATGVLVPAGGGQWRLKPRNPAETAVTFHPVPIATARTTAVGQLVVVEGIALNNWLAFGDSTVHLRDPSGYMRATRVLAPVAAGDSVRLIGTIATRDGQPVVNLATPTQLLQGVGVGAVDSVSTAVAASADGGARDAAHVRIRAPISTVTLLVNGDRLVDVNDGSGLLQVRLDADVAFNVAQYQPGAILRANGVLVPAEGGGSWQLKPRAPTDAIATFQPITIAQARTAPLGQLVVIEGAALNGFTVFGDSTVHIEDATGRIRATRVIPQAQGNQVQAGNRLRLVGTTAVNNGQRVIDLVTTTVLQEIVNLSAADSISTATAAAAATGSLDAAHATVGGTISATQVQANGDLLVTISDGSGAVGVLLDANITFTLSQYQPGAQLRAVGVLVPFGGAWRIKPRSPVEATISFQAIPIAQARTTAAGNLVVIEGVALNNWTAFGDSTVHMQDVSGTIRAVRVLADVAAGNRVRVIGTTAVRDGQPVIELGTPTLLQAGVGIATPDSVSTLVASTANAGQRDAGQVTIGGTISTVQTLAGNDVLVTVNDGTGPVGVLIDASLGLTAGQFTAGAVLRASGVLVPSGSSWRLKPRTPAEASTSFQAIPIATARTTPNGTLVVVEGVALNNWSAFGDSTVHLEDASGTIRAVRVVADVAAGSRVRLIGTKLSQSGQPVIDFATPTLLQPGVGTSVPDSISTAAAAAASGGRDADHVRIVGNIVSTQTQTGELWIDMNDGSGALTVVLDASLAFNHALYQPGARLSATGVLVPVGGGIWRLKPRAPAEATVSYHPISVATARATAVGQLVVVEGVALNNWTAFGDSTVHVKDPSGYIRATRVLANVAAGDSVRLIGMIATRDGQPVINLAAPTTLQTGVGFAVPDSVSTAIAASANNGALDAAHVRVAGPISNVQVLVPSNDRLVTINDGTSQLQVLLDADIAFNVTQLQPGAILRARGVLVPVLGGGGTWQLRPRTPTEAVATFEPITIAQARTRPLGQLVVIEGAALNGFSVFGDSTVHVEDASGYIRATRVIPQAQGAQVQAGNRLRLVGTTAMSNGQRVIDLVTTTVLQEVVNLSNADSITTALAATANSGALDAAHVTVGGTISATQTVNGDVLLTVNDGSGAVGVLLDASVTFNLALYQPGAQLRAVGVLVPSGGSWRLKPRSSAEATISFQAITIAQARAAATGSLVVVEGVALNNWSAFGDSTVHVEDATGTIRGVRVLADVAAGNRVRLIGTRIVRDGQPAIDLATPTLLQAGVGTSAPDSISTAAAAAASGGRDADHVRIVGNIITTQTQTGELWIDVNDGSGALRVVLDASLPFNHALYLPGARLNATGVLVPVGGVWRLKPRSPAEATVSYHPISIATARATAAGQLVVIEGVALNNWLVFNDSTVHLRDPSGSIRATRVLAPVAAGDSVRLIGTTATRDGQPVINLATPTLLQQGVGFAAPDSVSTAVAASAQGGVRDASHVRIRAPISAVTLLPAGDRIVTVNDGSGVLQVRLDADVAFNATQYQPGAILRANGVLVPVEGGGSWQLKPRAPAEAIATFVPITIAQARTTPLGQLVVIEGAALNGFAVFGDSTVHVEDGTGFIRATRVIPQAQGAQVQAGNRLRLVGTTAVSNGQRVIDLVTTTVLQEVVNLSTADSIATATAATAGGGALDAAHRLVRGTISASQTLGNGDVLLTVNDGSGAVGVVLDANIAFNLALYQQGADLRATGVLVPSGSVWQLKPRNPQEATTSFQPITIAQARAATQGALVVIEGIALNSWTTFGDSTVHMHDATGNIRTMRVAQPATAFAAGDRIRLVGLAAVNTGQPIINLATSTLLQPGVGAPAPDSISTLVASNAGGGSRDASLVKIGGTIEGNEPMAGGDRLIRVNDGSGQLQVILDAQIPFVQTDFQVGALLHATGVLVPQGGGVWRLKPRSVSDAFPTYPTVSIAAAKALGVGQTVFIEGRALNGRLTFGDQTVHVVNANGSTAIRTTNVPSVAMFAGDSVRILGTVAIVNAQKVLNVTAGSAVVLLAGVGTPAIDSVTTAVAAAAQGGVRDANQVAVSGTISAITPGQGGEVLLTISDGSGNLAVVLDPDVGIAAGSFSVGQFIRARGVLIPAVGGTTWELKPRLASEVVTIAPTAINSTVSAAPASVTANGTAASTVTMTVRDGANNPIVGLTAAAFNINLTGSAQRSAVTASATPGVYTFTVTNTVAQNVTVSVTVSGVSLSQQPAITFTAGAPVPGASDVAAAPATLGVGTAPSIVTVTVRDQFNNPIAGLTDGAFVIGLTGAAQRSQVTASTPGVYTFSVTDTVAQNVTVSVTVSGVALTQQPVITFTTGAPSAARSNASALPATLTAGTGPSTVTLTVRDQYNNPVNGLADGAFTIGLTGAAQRTPVTISATPGVYTFDVTDAVAQAVTVTITVNGVTLAQQPVITFTAAVPAAATSNVTALPTTVVADGTAASTVTVNVRDANNNPVTGLTAGAFTIGLTGAAQAGAITASATPGFYTFAVTDTVAQPVTVTVAVSGVSLTQQPAITFIPGPPSIARSNFVVPDTVFAGSPAVASITLRDAHGNLTPGQGAALSVAVTGANPTAVPIADNGNGSYSATYTPLVGGADNIAITVSSVAVPGPFSTWVKAIDAALTTLDAAPDVRIANGVDTSTVTIAVRDAFGNPIAGLAPGDFTIFMDGLAQFGQVSAATPGNYVFPVTSTVAEDVAVTVSIKGVLVQDEEVIGFLHGPPSAANTTVAAFSTTVQAGGIGTILEIHVQDQFNNDIGDLLPTDFVVQLSSGTAQSSAVTQVPEDPGYYGAIVTNSVAETVTVTVTVNGITATQQPVIQFIPGPPTAANSSADVPATGTAGAVTTMTITLRDANNNLVTGQAAALAANVTGANAGAIVTITETGNGTYSATYLPNAAGTDSIAITVSGNPIQGSPFSSEVAAGQ